jgi:FHA domain
LFEAMSATMDWGKAARAATRPEFVAAHPYYFLVGKRQMVAPRPRSTGVFGQLRPDTGESLLGSTHAHEVVLRADRTEPLELVCPLRHEHGGAPGQPISVGRTPENDVVLPDTLISRRHAVFRVHEDRIELGDAGSANGTFVGGKLLPPGGPSQIVMPGEVLGFSHLEFELLDAGAAWDRLVERSDPGR